MINRPFKIAVASGKGGVGKSMLASSLAILFAKNNKVITLDCDVDAPNLAVWLNEDKNWQKKIPIATTQKPKIDYRKCDGCGECARKCKFGAIKMINGKPKINPFLCEGCGLCELVCPKGAIKMVPVKNGEIRIKKTKYKFVLISGYLLPGETGSGKIVDEIKNQAQNFSYDIIIVDSAPGTGCPVISALKDVDLVILITEPTLSGFRDLQRTKSVVDHFHIPYLVVINKWDINKNVFAKIKKWAGTNFLGKITYNKEVFRAVSNLRPIMETDLKVKEEIMEIYENLPI